MSTPHSSALHLVQELERLRLGRSSFTSTDVNSSLLFSPSSNAIGASNDEPSEKCKIAWLRAPCSLLVTRVAGWAVLLAVDERLGAASLLGAFNAVLYVAKMAARPPSQLHHS